MKTAASCKEPRRLGATLWEDNPVPYPGPRGAQRHCPRRRGSARAARPAGVRASGHGHRGPTGVAPRRSRCKSCGAPSPSAAPRALGPGRAGRRPGEACRRPGRACLPGSRNTCCRARARSPQSMPPAFSAGREPDACRPGGRRPHRRGAWPGRSQGKMAGEGSIPGSAARRGAGRAREAARGTNLLSFPEPASCAC